MVAQQDEAVRVGGEDASAPGHFLERNTSQYRIQVCQAMFVGLNLPATLSGTEDLFNPTSNRFSLLYFKITGCFQILHEGVKGIVEHCKPWAVEDINF